MLRFDHSFAQSELFKELRFEDFVQLDFEKFNFVNYFRLEKWPEIKLIEHYEQLIDLERRMKKLNIETQSLIGLHYELPAIDDFLLPSVKEVSLFEAKMIYVFCRIHSQILSTEKKLFSSIKSDVCDFFIEKIKAYCLIKNNDFFWKESSQRKKWMDEIKSLEISISEHISNIEEEIYKETNVRFIYPFSKQVVLDNKQKNSYARSPYLEIIEGRSFGLVQFKLPENIKRLMNQLEKLKNDVLIYDKKQSKLLYQDLKSFKVDLIEQIRLRKHRLFLYLLCSLQEKKNLSWPKLSNKGEVIHLNQGRLPALEKIEKNYSPLNISIFKGSHVLLGANYSGKTTVLKTLYFILSLFKRGLPLPCFSLQTPFLEDIELLLRSSGQILTKQSGFSRELEFLSIDRKKPFLVLIDEFFSSTNPIAARKLSQVFLQHYSSQNGYFLISSNEVSLLDVSQVNFWKMSDEICHSNQIFNYKIEKINHMSFSDLERLMCSPLKIALKHNFSKSLKKNIEKALIKIKDKTHSTD